MLHRVMKLFYMCYQTGSAAVCLLSIQLENECASEDKPERDVVGVKHLCNTKQLSSVLLNWIQNHHLQNTHTRVGSFQTWEFGKY